MALFCALDLGSALLEWGEIETAGSFIRLADTTADTLHDDVPAQGWVSLGTASLAFLLDDPAEALAHAAKAIPLLERSAPAGLAEAHRVAALASAAQGRHRRADSHWAASLKSATLFGQKLEELRTRCAMASASAPDLPACANGIYVSA